MNQQAIDYLQKNKSDYSKESLVQQLKNVGYADVNIEEAINVVYGGALYQSDNILPSHTKDGMTVWLKNIFTVTFVALIVFGFVSNVVQNIVNTFSGHGSLWEYLLLIIYILPIILIINLVRKKPWAFLISGIWCAFSAVFILLTILFTPVGGAMTLLVMQFLIVAMLAGVGIYLGISKKSKQE
jgi:hypothetical protein